MRNKINLFFGYALGLLVITSIGSCEEDEGYCFKCKDEFETETLCYSDYKDDYTKEEFKEMVFNLEDFGFKCRRE
jgi:hypothetical protein